MARIENEEWTDEYLRTIRAMTPEQKYHTAQGLYQTAWDLKTAWLRKQYPDWTDEQLYATVREIFLYART